MLQNFLNQNKARQKNKAIKFDTQNLNFRPSTSCASNPLVICKALTVNDEVAIFMKQANKLATEQNVYNLTTWAELLKLQIEIEVNDKISC